MNVQGKQRILNYFVCCFIIVVFLGCSSCGGTRPVIVATDEPIVSSQISAARIEAINGELRTIISSYDSFIEREIGRAVGGIEAAFDALDRYDEFVQGLIYRIRELERATRNMDDEVSDPIQGGNGWTNSFLD